MNAYQIEKKANIVGNHTIHVSDTYEGLVASMRLSQWHKIETNLDYMVEVAERATTSIGVSVNTKSEKDFILDLKEKGIIDVVTSLRK